MGKLRSVLAVIDSTNEWLGKIVRFIPPIIMLVVTYEVVARYVFNRPTLWAFETNQYLFLTCVALGGGFAVLYKVHVHTDIIYSRLATTTRRKAIMDLVLTLVFFLFICFLVYEVFVMTVHSVSVREHAYSTLSPPIYPIKVIMFTGVSLAMLQGAVRFIRDLITAVTGKAETGKVDAFLLEETKAAKT